MSWGIENSIFLRQLGDLKEVYLTIEERINSVYLGSFTHRLVKKMNEMIKICFRYSFWGRISEIKEAGPVPLDDSRAVQYLVHFYKRWKYKITHYSGNSLGAQLVKDAKEGLYFSSVRMISLIIVITILVNAVLSVILQKQMGLWSFFIRVLFLFAGTAGLSCRAGWPTVKKSSIFLTKMRMD